MNSPSFQLEVISGPAPLLGILYSIPPGISFIGRNPACSLVLGDPKISGTHLRVLVETKGIYFEDQNSTNGTFINGQKVEKGTLLPGEKITLGECELTLKKVNLEEKTQPDQGEKEGINLTETRLGFSVIHHQGILDDPQTETSIAAHPAYLKLLKKYKLVQEITRALRNCLDIQEILQKILTHLFEALNCDSGYILLVDPNNPAHPKSHLAYDRGKVIENLDKKLYSKTLVNHVLQNKSGIIFDMEGETTANLAQSIVNLAIKTAICCPIHTEGDVFGVIYLDSKKGRAKFTQEDLDLTIAMAGMAGVAIENIRLIEKLKTEEHIRNNLKRFVSPNVANKIVQEQGTGSFHLENRKGDITILFADIRGFTNISENHPGLEVVRLLNTYFKEMCSIIFKYGGTLDKFIGDCVMVLFGAPVPLDAPELRAVQTAIEMQETTRKLMPLWTGDGIPGFSIGIGLNCGEAIIGSIGTDSRMEYTAIGDNVNIASRLCGIAAPQQILISDFLYQRVKGHIEIKSLEKIQVKGKVQSLLVHEVTGISSKIALE